MLGEVAASFWKIDLNEARATHWSVAIPPTSRSEKPLISRRCRASPSSFILSRRLGIRVASLLRPHITSTTNLASLLTVTNACVLCGPPCKNKWAASDHVRGHALRSFPVCSFFFGSATELQWHLRSHLEPYLTLGYLFVWPAHAVVVALSLAGSIRGRTGATAAGQAAALSGYVVGARRGRGRHRLNSAQAEAQCRRTTGGCRRRLKR